MVDPRDTNTDTYTHLDLGPHPAPNVGFFKEDAQQPDIEILQLSLSSRVVVSESLLTGPFNDTVGPNLITQSKKIYGGMDGSSLDHASTRVA